MIPYLVGAGFVLVIGYLIWFGSGSVFKAILGGIFIPVVALIVLSAVLGNERLAQASGPVLIVAIGIVVAVLVAIRR